MRESTSLPDSLQTLILKKIGVFLFQLQTEKLNFRVLGTDGTASRELGREYVVARFIANPDLEKGWGFFVAIVSIEVKLPGTGDGWYCIPGTRERVRRCQIHLNPDLEKDWGFFVSIAN